MRFKTRFELGREAVDLVGIVAMTATLAATDEPMAVEMAAGLASWSVRNVVWISTAPLIDAALPAPTA